MNHEIQKKIREYTLSNNTDLLSDAISKQLHDLNHDGKSDIRDIFSVKNLTELNQITYTTQTDFSQSNLYSCSDNWYYYNTNIDSNVCFVLFNFVYNTGGASVTELKVLKISINDNIVTFINPDNRDYDNNDYSKIKSKGWSDMKVVYTKSGDYAYFCTDYKPNNQNDKSDYINFVEIYRLDTLYNEENLKFVNRFEIGNFHNLQIYQDDYCAYLYGCGGQNNALQIYDICSNPEKPVFLGGYFKLPDGYQHNHSDPLKVAPLDDVLYIHDLCVWKHTDTIYDMSSPRILGAISAIQKDNNVVIVDMTNPLDVKSIVNISDPVFQTNQPAPGIHNAWYTPNHEFLLIGEEINTKFAYIVNLRNILSQQHYFYNDPDLNLKHSYGYIGKFQLNTLLRNYHNFYTYYRDENTFYLCCACYAEGTKIFIGNYNKLRSLLVYNNKNIAPVLNDAFTLVYLMRTTDERNFNLNTLIGQNFPGGVWNAMVIPSTKYVFETMYTRSDYPSYGCRVWNTDKVLTTYRENTSNISSEQYYNYDNDLRWALSRDPNLGTYVYRIHFNNYDNNYYKLVITKNGSTFKNTYLVNYFTDIGNLENSASEDVTYRLTVTSLAGSEILNTNNSNYTEVVIPPHTNTSMSHTNLELRSNDKYNLNNGDPKIDSVVSDYNPNLDGYIITTTLRNIEWYAEGISFQDGTDLRCHAHLYKYNGSTWDKIGRLLEKHYISNEIVGSGAWFKITLTSNSHRMFTLDGMMLMKKFPLGNDPGVEP